MAFANTDSAVRTWLKTSSTRGKLLNKLLETAGHCLYSSEMHKDLRSSRILTARGRVARDTFIEECRKEASRFEEPIKQMKILNFAVESFKKGNRSRPAAKVVESQIDLEAVFSYPLTLTPQSLAHIDGSIRKAEKLILMRELEEKLPNTLCGVAHNILMKVMRMAAKRVDLVLDTYNSPSIKDIECQARGEGSARQFLLGPGQKTSKHLSTLLRSGEFKTGFTKFLVANFKDESHGPLISWKELYCAVDKLVFSEDVEQLARNHEEADTRIAFHAKHSSELGTDNIVVRANDTDVLVNLLASNESFSGSHLWLEVDVSENNSRRLPLSENADQRIEEFACKIYGQKGLKDINKACFLIFCTKHKPVQKSRLIEGIKSINPTTFPPSKRELKQQILRSNYVARIWQEATSANPSMGMEATDKGWRLETGQLIVNSFEGEQVPNEEELLGEDEIEEAGSEENSSEGDVKETNSDISDFED
eukprot:gene3985-4535_t